MTESQFQPHRRFRIVPAMPLDTLAHSAFIGAAYHLGRIKKLASSPCMQTMWKDDDSLENATKKRLQADVDQFHWHVRAFFWELVASFDTMLQWVNQRFELSVPEDKVRWSTIHEKAAEARKDQAEWNKKHALLESAWDSAWYYEIRQYRNFAHRAFIFVNAEYNGNYGKNKPTLKKVWLTPAREGQQEYVDIVLHLLNYLEEISQLGEKIFRQ